MVQLFLWQIHIPQDGTQLNIKIKRDNTYSTHYTPTLELCYKIKHAVRSIHSPSITKSRRITRNGRPSQCANFVFLDGNFARRRFFHIRFARGLLRLTINAKENTNDEESSASTSNSDNGWHSQSRLGFRIF